MLVVTDLEDMFVPLSTGFLVGLDESRELIEQLLTQLPTMFAGAASAESALGAATQAVLAALVRRRRPPREGVTRWQCVADCPPLFGALVRDAHRRAAAAAPSSSRRACRRAGRARWRRART